MSTTELQTRIKSLDVQDDGIKFNQKSRFIMECWTKNYPSKEDVQKSVKSLYKNSLKDADLAAKVLLLLTSIKFVTQEVSGENIRGLFVKRMHKKFDSSKKAGFVKDDDFRMSVRILGNFYNKARTENGEELTFLGGPLITLLGVLMNSDNVVDVKLFTSQMFLNGLSLKRHQNEKYNQVNKDLRKIIITVDNVQVKNWLMFSLESSSMNYKVLPLDMEMYYTSIVNDAEFKNVYQLTLENHQQRNVFNALNTPSPMKEVKKVLKEIDENISQRDKINRYIPRNNHGSQRSSPLARRIEAIRNKNN